MDTEDTRTHDPDASETSKSAQDLFAARMGDYQQIWEDATAKMMRGTYRSEDLVEDWFRWWGQAARDMTAATTLAMRGASQFQPDGVPSNGAHDGGGHDE